VAEGDYNKIRPHVLITKYPFFVPMLQLPKFLASQKCLGKDLLNQALYELYGVPEDSPALHVNLPGYPRYYIMLELHKAIDYYMIYMNTDIDELIG
jgi:hypothetical protein